MEELQAQLAQISQQLATLTEQNRQLGERSAQAESAVQELRNENRFLAGAFFWSYMVLALFLLLNFLIAIISESFAQVSGKAFSTPFEELLLRGWQSMKAYFAPSNIARLCGNACRGKGEATLLRRVISEMEVQHDLRQEQLLLAKRERQRIQEEQEGQGHD